MGLISFAKDLIQLSKELVCILILTSLAHEILSKHLIKDRFVSNRLVVASICCSCLQVVIANGVLIVEVVKVILGLWVVLKD